MRDEKVDSPRFVGLAMVVLAHVGPPEWLFQLRNFDVLLMVLLSGISFILKFPLVLLLAAALTYLQVTCLRTFLLPQLSNPTLQKNLNLLFTG